MRLTPADVHNVAFKKPSLGKRGYDEDEVDAFLDLIEAELSRLIEENNELSQRLAAVSDGGVASDSTSGNESASVQHPDQGDRESPEGTGSVQDSSPAASHVQAVRLLSLAQETAERLTGEAEAEATRTRDAAKAESEKLVTDAQAEAHRLVTEAQGKSDAMVGEATARAEALERDSRIRADAMDREAQGKYAEVMGQLAEQRGTLEKKIDDLRVYEREYRSRLKSWITEQLAQLHEGGAVENRQEPVAQGAE